MAVITADEREPPDYRDMFDQVSRLTWGDYLIETEGPDGPIRLVVERKTVSDFINSLHQNRLNHQLAHVDVLVIEKTWVPKGAVDWWGFYDKVNAVSLRTPVLWALNREHLYHVLRLLEKKATQGTLNVLTLRRPKVEGIINDRQAFYVGLPGLGEKWARRADTVYERPYDLIKDLFRLCVNSNHRLALEGEKGFGRGKALKIRSWLMTRRD